MKKEFNQLEYIKEFNKKNYKQFKADLKILEKEELNKLLKKHNLSNAEFIRKSKKILERGMYMRKYLVIKNTQHFEKRGEWISAGDCIDTKQTKIFDNKEDADKYYNELELNDIVEASDRYSDYKEMYEYDATEVTDEMIKDNDYDIEEMKFIKDDYSFVQ